MSLKEKVDALRAQAEADLAAAGTLEQAREVRVKYLGKSGPIADFMKNIRELTAAERPDAGKLANGVKAEIEERLAALEARLEGAAEAARLAAERIDVTLPGRPQPVGSLHPINETTRRIVEIFHGLGFEAAEGPEIESDFHNFEALNFKPEHPARDMQDTFYIAGDLLLRTHTSPVQVRVMTSRKPPLRIVAPGRTYRRDSDMTHSPMFHQVEGFVVDDRSTFADLRGVLTAFFQALFGKDLQIRFRPSFFPFVEPGVEVDLQCVICRGAGCRTCKHTGWLEVMGAGMIHPNVLRAVGYDPERWQGYAFGMGVERCAMLLHGLSDMRLLFENDVRFLRQFV
jgi:phenylalanyl-tRNA synthetase alpha chain